MYYQLVFDDVLSADEQALVTAYWQVGEGVFVHKVQDLATERAMTVPAVTTLVAQKSHLLLFVGYCEGCGDEVLEKGRYRDQVGKVLKEYGPRRCPSCQQAWEKRQSFELCQAQGRVGNPMGPNAQSLLLWQQLPATQQHVLDCLLENEERGAVHARLFPPELESGSELWNQRWGALTQLERRFLIKVFRENDNRITGYQVHPEVRRQWQGTTRPAVQQPEQELRMSLQPSLKLPGQRRPAYADAFRVPRGRDAPPARALRVCGMVAEGWNITT